MRRAKRVSRRKNSALILRAERERLVSRIPGKAMGGVEVAWGDGHESRW